MDYLYAKLLLYCRGRVYAERIAITSFSFSVSFCSRFSPSLVRSFSAGNPRVDPVPFLALAGLGTFFPRRGARRPRFASASE
jgi:hypothetical protein